MVYRVIGLMSGTSLDGLDLAYCHIWENDNSWNFELKETKSIFYEPQMKTQLKDAIHLGADELLIFNNEYGKWLGQKTREFINEYNLEVDFISSHGHTIHHQPENGLTYQIGSGQHMANTIGHNVICDFRTNDLALGGQGAPLVPIGDCLLFKKYDFCLNLGGISNISFDYNYNRVAYDIGLANMILNYSTQKMGIQYDKGGAIASKGKINEKLLAELNALAYYDLPFPKSTGYEWFAKEVIPIIEKFQDPLEDILNTAIHHICEKIAFEVHKYKSKKESSILITGGGALNTFLMEVLEEKLGPTLRIEKSDYKLIEFKEALVFAFMGVLRFENKTNVLSSVTGAKRDSSSGVVFLSN
nr:anhydro-N-acetylmuramic acid kinase [uncultured bacterium]